MRGAGQQRGDFEVLGGDDFGEFVGHGRGEQSGADGNEHEKK
jgi:hypothetical protein